MATREELDATLTREERVICRLVDKRGFATYEQVAQAYLDHNEKQLAAWSQQLKAAHEAAQK